MTVDFGKVEKYIEDRGFGFVSHTFVKTPPENVFFHIKVVKKTHPVIAQSLDSTLAMDSLFFWYEYGVSPKGHEVIAILNVRQIRKKYADQVAAFIATIKANWVNIEKPLSETLKKATLDILTLDEANQLAEHRKALQVEKKRHQTELQKAEILRLEEIAAQRAAQQEIEFARQTELREAEILRLKEITALYKAEALRLKEIAAQRAAQQEIESARRKAIADQRSALERMEEEEFNQLVIEMSAMGFTHSTQVSKYIVNNKLGYKYKYISGVLQMQLDSDVWDFDGGFPPRIYARLCEALGLGNQGSRAVPGKFTPYKDIL